MIKLTKFQKSISSISMFALTVCVIGIATPLSARAQANGMFIYPKNGQSQQLQDKDRYECHTWAVNQTGFDPSRMSAGNPNAYDPQPYRPSQPHILKGA